ncbi:MAG: GAF domain-containing protein, partial [Nocardioidaceae bacterium]|nr:GAF domain-containing protein [Nocardioidaceae bacterium]
MTRERAWPRPDDDHARVAALHELGILDRPHDAELAGLTRLASYVCGTPAAVLNLVDEERQVQVAAHGFAPVETSRDEAMCGYSILSREVTYTPDASRDAVFADNPFVTGELADVRLYASAPVVVDDEHVVGTICAFASEPAQLEPEQLERLRDLADAAARILELRRSTERLALAATRDPLTGLPNRAHL